MLNDKDFAQLKERNIDQQQVMKQVERLRKGTHYITAVKPATIGDGIIKLDENSLKNLLKAFDEDCQYYHFTKFVPASGAASRMFKDLFSFVEKYDDTPIPSDFLDSGTPAARFINGIERFAFYEELNKKALRKFNLELKQLKSVERYVDIVKLVLANDGLNYGNSPKALIKFHKYGNVTRLSLEEHFVEAAEYAQNNDKTACLHFTVSPEHKAFFTAQIERLKSIYESRYGIEYHISMSEQKPSTDTVAIDDNGDLFREKDGRILFRPGGHGALIENLNDLGEEIVFIKNIDNIAKENLAQNSFKYKKALSSCLMQLQQKTFEYLEMLDEGNISNEELDEIIAFAKKELMIDIPDFIDTYSEIEKIDYLYNKLNRPMRVCGMVKNEGEPGGGPYWIRNNNDEVSLQIVESSQFNHNDAEQERIFKAATHFNPVDLVCGCRNYKGENFNLNDYVDEETGFVSSKSKDGRELKALELPGLWNGAMADWITVFVEVPLETFNPVKTVNDLLKKMHQD